ncbi:hypothetical protein RhiirA4_474679 [Rhizophagus irregularis]|uniref:Uncharacterized protein n=1 Tax=Rhizophagus irregularis TaxID=588596 RepID=A0A2I1H8W7_9GLOM|nr:hypothetical protein RhiirA4_474679 [Rhizophagus irregularis]
MANSDQETSTPLLLRVSKIINDYPNFTELVNKRWCLLVVPILWEKHTRYIYHEAEKKFHNIILSSLSSSSKQFLGDSNNIKLPSTIISKP